MRQIQCLICCWLIACSLLPASVAEAMTAEENLSTCLQGSYPTLCRHELLTEAQRVQVRAAEKRENLALCLQGRYPTLCRHADLTQSERRQVEEAEYQANLETCLAGHYKSICRHKILKAQDLGKVKDAEKAANRTNCLNGYAGLCDLSQLDAESRKKAMAAQARVVAEGKAMIERLARQAGLDPATITPSQVRQLLGGDQQGGVTLDIDDTDLDCREHYQGGFEACDVTVELSVQQRRDMRDSRSTTVSASCEVKISTQSASGFITSHRDQDDQDIYLGTSSSGSDKIEVSFDWFYEESDPITNVRISDVKCEIDNIY